MASSRSAAVHPLLVPLLIGLPSLLPLCTEVHLFPLATPIHEPTDDQLYNIEVSGDVEDEIEETLSMVRGARGRCRPGGQGYRGIG